jgi:hypothetical protein
MMSIVILITYSVPLHRSYYLILALHPTPLSTSFYRNKQEGKIAKLKSFSYHLFALLGNTLEVC